jgi:hypothetical protein
MLFLVWAGLAAAFVKNSSSHNGATGKAPVACGLPFNRYQLMYGTECTCNVRLSLLYTAAVNQWTVSKAQQPTVTAAHCQCFYCHDVMTC